MTLDEIPTVTTVQTKPDFKKLAAMLETQDMVIEHQSDQKLRDGLARLGVAVSMRRVILKAEGMRYESATLLRKVL